MRVVFLIKKGIVVLLVLILIIGILTPLVQAATLEFSPSDGTFSDSFDVDIKVDTDGEDTKSTDAVIEFDNTMLSVDSVSYGSIYPTVLHTEQNSKLFISGMVDDAATVVNDSGVLATISFNILTTGTASLSFECVDGRTDDSNVAKDDNDATDILVCSSLNSASYTVSGSGTAPTSEPSDPDITTVEDPVDSIPATGLASFVQFLPRMFIGLIFIIAGLIPLLI